MAILACWIAVASSPSHARMIELKPKARAKEGLSAYNQKRKPQFAGK